MSIWLANNSSRSLISRGPFFMNGIKTDEVVAMAMLDRFLHHAQVVSLKADF